MRGAAHAKAAGEQTTDLLTKHYSSNSSSPMEAPSATYGAAQAPLVATEAGGEFNKAKLQLRMYQALTATLAVALAATLSLQHSPEFRDVHIGAFDSALGSTGAGDASPSL